MKHKGLVLAAVILVLLLIIWAGRRHPAACLLVGAGVSALVVVATRKPAILGGTPPALSDALGVPPDELRAISQITARRLSTGSLPVRVDDLKYLPYHPRTRDRRSLHVGQRKLLLSEVDFLTDYARPGDTVVYAGSAPGTHIVFLAQLLQSKRLRFALYDPRRFAPGLETATRISLHTEFFTDETAQRYANRDDVLFISDVRTGATEGEEFPSESAVGEDMTAQMQWVRLMNPRAAMLKFRLGYDAPGSVEYLAGERRLQAWAPSSSTEMRLVVSRPYDTTIYDVKDNEGRMFFLNHMAAFDHGIPLRLVRGLDYCFDCATEARIWYRYIGGLGRRPRRKWPSSSGARPRLSPAI
jgi:hypothetical protein